MRESNFNSNISKYAYDKGWNLIQKRSKDGGSYDQRMIVCQSSNRAISDLLYQDLDLSPSQKADLNGALFSKKVFDAHGNQLQSSTVAHMSWEYKNMLQTTQSDLGNGRTLNEYNVYGAPGQRSRKVSKKTDDSGNVYEIKETLYIGSLEYRTTWQGEDLSYDGETVTENGNAVSPFEKYMALRIRQGHKQVARKLRYFYRDGEVIPTSLPEMQYTLDNNIDSCEMTLGDTGKLRSYQSFQPYGDTCISYGNTENKQYKYSGQEEDESKLYDYGMRSYQSANFRWMSPDPAGVQGSDLNWYAMVNGNPVTMRDEFGLMKFFMNGHFNSVFLKAYMYDVIDTSTKYRESKKYLDENTPSTLAQNVKTGRRKHWPIVTRSQFSLYGEKYGPGSEIFGSKIKNENEFGKYDWKIHGSLLYKEHWYSFLKPNPEHLFFRRLASGNTNYFSFNNENDSKMQKLVSYAITNLNDAWYYGAATLNYFPVLQGRRMGFSSVFDLQEQKFLMVPVIYKKQPYTVHGTSFDSGLSNTSRAPHFSVMGRMNDYYKLNGKGLDENKFIGFTAFYEKAKNGKPELVLEFLSRSVNGVYNHDHGHIVNMFGDQNSNIDYNSQPTSEIQQHIAQSLANSMNVSTRIRGPHLREHIWRNPGKTHFKPQ